MLALEAIKILNCFLSKHFDKVEGKRERDAIQNQRDKEFLPLNMVLPSFKGGPYWFNIVGHGCYLLNCYLIVNFLPLFDFTLYFRNCHFKNVTLFYSP